VLLANSYNDLKDKEIFEISISDLANALQHNSKNDKRLKQVLKDLIGITIEWKDKKNTWHAEALLADVQIINEVLYYKYASALRKELDNPIVYETKKLSSLCKELDDY